ncbi:MAG: class I SAM-dependent methyltransferase [Acidobacteria bacterium]|nr:class I SAM-dependent methyltransferase [Acidobacteriota bacterium]MCA1608149.1 class I SAM-dependent methyltransferase [Acidobacteriota bacterium]
MREQLVEALTKYQTDFSLSLSDTVIQKLADYYQIVEIHNPILHLTAPSTSEVFAVRHILESLTLLEFLPRNAKLADIGAGAGLPSIPCLVARKDLSAILIESKEKKARFLEEAVHSLSLATRAEVVNRQFEEAVAHDATMVTCRALDKFVEKLARLIRWSGRRPMLFFGGDKLESALAKQAIEIVDRRLMPFSERRYLFDVRTVNRRNID